VHSAAEIAQVARSMQEFGWTIPVLVDEEGVLIAGHRRVAAAAQLGWPEAPVMVAVGWPEAKKRAYVIADNQLALNASWDESLVRAELDALGIAGFDLSVLGFSDQQLAEFIADSQGSGGSASASVPGLEELAVSRRGDTWILGEHRVHCGDATNRNAVALFLGLEQIDCLWTDPPYNVSYAGGRAIKGDDQDPEQFLNFLTAAFTSAALSMKPGATAYVAHAETEGINFRLAFEAAGFKLASCLVWVKNALVLGHSDYHYQHEPILYGWRDGGAHKFYGRRKKTSVMKIGDPPLRVTGDGQWLLTVGDESFVIRGTDVTLEQVTGSVFFENKPHRSAEHPTMKPVELIERMLAVSSKRGQLVLDPFGGSGSTLIASDRLGRRARLMEIDPLYVDVIVRRWQTHAGQSATLAASGLTFSECEQRGDTRTETEAEPPSDS
jgi:DNA modification methylase